MFNWVSLDTLLLILLLPVSLNLELESGMFIGGIQVNEPDMEEWVSALDAAGMNTVEVTVYARNGDWDSKWMKFEEEEPAVIREIRAAKRHNLKVVLVLRMALDHYYPANKFLWHGMIFPVERSDLDEWFNSYQAYVNKWSEIAEEEGVDVLVIGSELNAIAATTPTDSLPEVIEWFGDSARHKQHEARALKYQQELREEHLWTRGFGNYQDPEVFIEDKVTALYHWSEKAGMGGKQASLRKINARRKVLLDKWTETIEGARRRFDGQLSFAANFDNYKEVAFWDQLDFIGINAYFPLRPEGSCTKGGQVEMDELKANWARVLNEIQEFTLENELGSKPVLFTELGYTRKRHCSVKPWKGDGFSIIGKGKTEQLVVWQEQPDDHQERVIAVNALYEAVRETQFPLQGILYWKLSSIPHLAEIEPFGMHVSAEPTDSLQPALTRFLDLPGE